MTNWTLEYFGQGITPGSALAGQANTLAGWGISKLKITRQSHKADVMSFTVATALVDDQELFGYLSLVGLYRDGVQWFYGYVTQIPRQGAAAAESMEYEVSSPWFALKQVVFQQQWYSTNIINGLPAALIPTNRSRIILGSNNDGTKMSLGLVLNQTLAWCISSYVNAGQAAPFQIGLVTPTLIVPYSEVTDRSCEELVQLCLKWLPDAATWFDYSTTPPKLNIAQRSGLPSLTLSLGSAPISEIPKLTPRYDLVPSVVVVKYEQTDTIGGTSYDVLTVDQYPANIPDTIPRALVQTINLIGTTATYLQQTITTVPRPTDYATNSDAPDNAEAYIQLKHPALAKIPTGDLLALSLVTTIDPKSPDQSTGPSVCPYELVKGHVASWMPEGIHQQLMETFTVQYAGSDPQFSKLFPDPPTSSQGGSGNTLTFVLPVTATNLTSGLYETLSSLALGEPVPVGLAQGQYNALSTLHYEGSVRLVEQELGTWLLGQGFSTWFGNNLNLGGFAQTIWSTMAARVEAVSEDIDSGTTQVSLGPPKILGLEDWHALLKAQRGRQPTLRLQQKQDAQVNNNSVKGPDLGPQSAVVNASGSGGSQGSWPFRIYDTSASGEAAITVNGTGSGSTSVSDGFAGNINGIDDSNANVRQTVSGTGVVYIQLTLDANQTVTAVASMVGATVPADVISSTGFPSQTCRKIGSYNVTTGTGNSASTSAGVSNTSNTGYVSYQFCNLSGSWW